MLPPPALLRLNPTKFSLRLVRDYWFSLLMAGLIALLRLASMLELDGNVVATWKSPDDFISPLVWGLEAVRDPRLLSPFWLPGF
jgi:hypothetical protein